jgi:hypothetical protein
MDILKFFLGPGVLDSKVRLYIMYEKFKMDFSSLLVFIVQIWPERTDPQKFVYEDVAIAAYLLVCV